METSTYNETRRVSRYVVVKAITKSGGALIYGTTLWLYGVDELLYAYYAVSAFSTVIDFMGQKFWTFKNQGVPAQKMKRDFCLYVLIRATTVLGTTGTVFLLTGIFGMRMWVATVFALSIFVPIVFLFSRLLFFGTIRDLWTPLQAILKRH